MARAAGGSQASVSRVIKADPGIRRGTRENMLETARKFGYDVRRISGRWDVGVIVAFNPQDINGYYAVISAAVTGEFFRRGLHPELIRHQELPEESIRTFLGIIDLHQTPESKRIAAFQAPVLRINGISNHLNHIRSVNKDFSLCPSFLHLHPLRNPARKNVPFPEKSAFPEKRDLTKTGF